MSNISKEISIVTGSRLHWGLLTAENKTGSSFGGVGVMIEQPSVHLSIRPCRQDIVSATDIICSRVASFVTTYRANCPDDLQPPPCQIVIHETIPSHRGLGSGTQLAMAIAHGLALSGDAPFAHDAKELAKRIGRGARSAIGIHGFLSGGLIYDAGKKQKEEISSIAATHPFPHAWRFLLVTPKDEIGLSG
ncbi:beta-ribofuranosylaminobenzene 5'-phosphate synthase, partial [hydrothermal vent metagenome]